MRDDMEGMGGTLQGQDTEVCERTELVEKRQGCRCDRSGLGEEGEGREEEFISLFSIAFRCTVAVNECSVTTGSLTALSRSRKVGMSQHQFL